ncbi:MAG TPA: DUF4906 domain-containing protein [Candidatus Bacteroides merdavium]|uniref:DUF4906 domain-containing protein n=1 Tax=Candidatus Bacteroides merdavium TaxID=2838472 RepID=A0A9D2KC59_9BACE|nr:DUF4906 domain-containing protein [Candidatus Bacteroides merdavium]
MKLLKYIMIGCCALLMACQQEEPWQDTGSCPEGNGLQLSIQTDGLLNQYTVTTRGTDIKTPEEQEIKSLHVFIFDADGNYLEAADEHRYQGYRSITGGKTVMNVDREGWSERDKAKKATVIVVANVEEGTFQSATADTPPTNITNLGDLANFQYTPSRQRYITELPESGMPMYGRVDGVDLTSDNTKQSIDILMKALMARIDVSVQINSDNSDVTGTLPQLTVTSCKVLNAPKATVFTENPDAETNLSTLGKADYTFPSSSLKTIQNKKGILEYTFYTFENLQNPNDELQVVKNEKNEIINWEKDGILLYPDSIKDEEKQQYKPELADKDNSIAFQFAGNYITYNGANYNVTYTLYLGANHTNDFKVMRNKQYKNNVTIKGIVKAGNNPQHITFDTRVNISQSNPYFVSILKDRELDSHFNVVPMDIYFFNTNPSNLNPPKQTMKVEIEDPDNVWWVRMEKIPASYMEAGTAPVVSKGPELLTYPNEAWHAGNGKRKYFTTDLVTETLSGYENTTVEVTDSRDRIYFYIDENVEVWHLGTSEDRTRTATVKMTYYEDGEVKGTRELTLEQAKLLEVTFHGPENDGPDGPDDETDGMTDKIIYIEAYEEYLDHGDPLDEYANNQVFTGRPWGANNTEIGSLRIDRERIESYRNWYWGHDFTSTIVEKAEKILDLTLNERPETAAGYCYIKNKRNSDGTVTNPKWYLPGIRELERILEDYYIEYTEFQNNYYWSSSAGESSVWGLGITFYENQQRARATKAYIGDDGKFHYYESGEGHNYTSESGTGGAAYRTQSLRIRAARIDAEKQ